MYILCYMYTVMYIFIDAYFFLALAVTADHFPCTRCPIPIALPPSPRLRGQQLDTPAGRDCMGI